VPRADRRQRKKDNARLAREARAAALRRQRQRKTAVRVGIFVVLFAIVVALFAILGGNDRKSKAATPTSTAPTATTVAAGKLPAGCNATVPPIAKATRTFASAPAMQIDPAKTYTATITTSCGDIVATLDTKNAPKGVNNFVFLANQHFYDGLQWHRVVKDFVIQGGDPKGDGTGGPGYSVATELPPNGYPLGTLAWAKTGQDAPGTAGSQFFVVSGNSTQALAQKVGGKYQYGVFGHVIQGMDVARKLESLAPSSGDGAPTHKIYIFKVAIAAS
jgi:cyclophilin family peptidyl-prolyl cis-trans isomerase